VTGCRAAGGALLAAALLTGVVAASPAHADDTGYRYWSFWEGADGGGWSYATQGPGTLRTDDGDVLGFRFAVSPEASDTVRPRAEPDFDLICPPTEAPVEGNRVALVIDHGTPAHAPDGERPPEPPTRTACAEVPDGATAAEALAEVAEPLRYNADGLLCAIDGYPAGGCGEQITDSGDAAAPAEPTDDAAASGGSAGEGDDDGSGSTVAVVTGVVVVAFLAAAAVFRSRRRRG
jgi:hypothetical protein